LPSAMPHHDEVIEKTEGGAVITESHYTLEWVVQTPPPLHAFEEPPMLVEWPEGEDGGH